MHVRVYKSQCDRLKVGALFRYYSLRKFQERDASTRSNALILGPKDTANT